jgi:nucleotide-binding universal stress UspA family protein
MRSILVNVDRRPGMEARLESALSLARAFGGHVTLLVDTPVARYVSMDPMGGSFVASEALRQAMDDDLAYAATLEARLVREDVPFDIVRSEAEPVDALARAARLADLVVLSRSGGVAGELALASSTPVLALADDTALTAPLGKACIAWDGGDEAACALRHAVQLLHRCESVSLVTVVEKSGGFPATDALSYLSRHGISAELVELSRQGTTEETIDAEVSRSGADLLVMGAFGRSRIREYLFGGVTRYFLENPAGPALFLAH